MSMIPETVKAIVLDFGNVVINIEFEATFRAFAQLTMKPYDRIVEIFEKDQIFQRYEKGLFSTEEFRDVIRQSLGYPLQDDEIDKAWNALLLDVPPQRIKKILDVKAQYPVYLLSNTNDLHIKTSDAYFKNHFGIHHVKDIFDQAFYSFEMGLWKPDPKIYTTVLETIGCKPSEVLFVDDNESNIVSARDLGINTIHLSQPLDLINVL